MGIVASKLHFPKPSVVVGVVGLVIGVVQLVLTVIQRQKDKENRH